LSTPSADRLAAHLVGVALGNGPDPFPSIKAPPTTNIWVYAPRQYQAGTLERLVAEGFAANRFVHYTQNYTTSDPTLTARYPLDGTDRTLTITATGFISVDLDGNNAQNGTTAVTVHVPATAQLLVVRVTVSCGPAAFTLTAHPSLDPSGWLTSTGSNADAGRPAELHPGAEQPPHLVGGADLSLHC